MTDPIWKKEHQSEADPALMAFMAGEDVMLDRDLLPYDIQASKAHARGLAAIDVLSKQELVALCETLDELATEFAAGEFVLDQRYEDGHSAIEHYLTAKLGDTGRKIHTGRSRNDQVAVAMRLWLLDQLEYLTQLSADIADACMNMASKHQHTVMPGYTHLQSAMPSSVGLWMAGFAEAFIDNGMMADATYQWLDQCPLGTASGFGVNLPLPREDISEDLGFSRLQINPQYVQNSRGKFEIQALQALSNCSQDCRRLAWDLSLFSCAEFAFIQLPEKYCTGSSIMPNKNNPDAIELLRASHAVVVGALNELYALLSLPSGYQRDLQLTKAATFRGFKSGMQALALLPDLMTSLRFNVDKMAAAVTADMFATDHAMELVKQGLPFREAYQHAANSMESLSNRSPQDSLAGRESLGGCANLGLEHLHKKLKVLKGE